MRPTIDKGYCTAPDGQPDCAILVEERVDDAHPGQYSLYAEAVIDDHGAAEWYALERPSNG
ncbi:hypothetical protein IU500_03190 [Nocardia terpenica]|uniref:hypothetical protein n=1 Tax=Nocardia terpenica TaxID=455432 RepID=UPI0018957F8F|nr:hypothetical protein [Nocardia terpenica]MBF6059415.1 hypothetical protein [Nocardia terpenica]MBF6103046.1 hypothetical protein [Nocardia terpenica]MBF6110765.1 hypothetical protein [Nocardia terpenica]MBF6116896.1 hypothetical protein [Nocardia terpenica]MBF6151266.1 hypothetical protein [Nocardia terpenica]